MGAMSADREAVPTVLYVEDDGDSVRLMRTILSALGTVRFLSAAEGAPGLELAREHQPDLILLDLDLPDISGLELRDRLQRDERTREIPVVALSATSDPSPDWLGNGTFAAYVPKPLQDVSGLLALLGGLVSAGGPAGGV